MQKEKKCRLCGILKPETLDHFYAVKDRPSGIGSQCRECIRERHRSLKYKERSAELRRFHYATDEAYRERTKAGDKRRKSTPRELARRRVYTNEWRATLVGRAHQLMSSARFRAAAKGVPFELTRDWILAQLEVGHCQATGLPFDFGINYRNEHGMRGSHPFGPSLDRIDAAKGYVVGNVRVVLWSFNLAVGNWGESVLRTVATAWLERASASEGRLSNRTADGPKTESPPASRLPEQVHP